MFEIASLNFAFFFFFRESSIYFEKPLIFSGILFPWPKLLRNAGNLSPGYYIVFNFLHLVVFLVFKRYVAFLNFFYSSRGFPNVVKTTFMQYDKNRCFEVVVHIMSISKHLKCINYRVCPIYSKQFKGLERLKNIPCLVMNVEEMKFILTKTTFLEDNSVNMSLWNTIVFINSKQIPEDKKVELDGNCASPLKFAVKTTSRECTSLWVFPTKSSLSVSRWILKLWPCMQMKAIEQQVYCGSIV